MEYKIEKLSEISNLKEFEFYCDIIGYSEGLFLARKRYNNNDKEEIKEFFKLNDEQINSFYSQYNAFKWSSWIDIYFFIDPITNKILGPYDYAEPFSCGLAIIDHGKRAIDKKGNTVINTYEISTKGANSRVTWLYSFKEDIATAAIYRGENQDECNAFLNKDWKFIHKRYYDEAGDFCNEVAIVYKNDKEYIVDKIGNMHMNPFENTQLGSHGKGFSEGLCPIQDLKTKKYGFIDIDFNLVIPMEYEDVKEFSCGLAAVRKGDKWGYIDKAGNVKIPFIFDEASSFKNGVAVVNKKVKNGRLESALINTVGKVILDYNGNDIDIYDGVIVLNDFEYIPIEDMKISYSVRIKNGSDFEDKNFDSLEERDLYFELASKEIKDFNAKYKEKAYNLKKEVYGDLDKKLDELKDNSLVKKHAQ